METMLEKPPETIPKGHILYENTLIEDTFAEMFPMWAGRILITAENENWALIAARTTTGFASSIIMSPAEAGIESVVSHDKTPDGRIGTLIQIYHRTRRELRVQMIQRISQCVMTCPTTAAFDALELSDAPVWAMAEWGIGRGNDAMTFVTSLKKGLELPACRFIRITGEHFNPPRCVSNPALVQAVKALVNRNGQ